MLRQLLIALGVVSLELGYQGIGLALVCPNQPEQTGKDWEGEVNAAMARMGPVSGGEVKTKAKTVTQDLLGKLPDAGKIYLEQMKYATICSSIRDDKTLSESEKRKQMREYDLEIQKAREHPSSGTKQPAVVPSSSKQPGKMKGSDTQSRVNPSIAPPAETKQPEMQKTCEESIVGLKRQPKVFVLAWRSVLERLHNERLTYDLLNLFEVWGRIPVGLTGKDLIHEAIYTLNCLEQEGQLRMEKLGTTGKYWGEDFENQTITFRNP